MEYRQRRLCFPLSEWICLLPGSNICEPFHWEAFLPRMIIEVHIFLKETKEEWPKCVCLSCVNTDEWTRALPATAIIQHLCEIRGFWL